MAEVHTWPCDDPTEHNKPWHCCHGVRHLQWVTHSNGSRHVKWVCAVCGWASDAVRQDTIDEKVLAGLSDADPERRQAWEAEQQEKIKQMYCVIERSEAMTERQIRYTEFVKSPAWRVLRVRRLQADGYICADCGGDATQAHHIWYPEEDHWEETPLWALISLCENCHRKAHRIFKRGSVPWGIHDDTP